MCFALTKNVLSRTKIKASEIPIEQTSGGTAAAKIELGDIFRQQQIQLSRDKSAFYCVCGDF